jgi:predicted enzyme related to lactoylglutathione lyase
MTSAATTPATAVRGRFVWYDLQTSDPAAAIEFYTKLFGWGTAPFDTGPGAPSYTMWTIDGSPIGGIMQEANVPPNWLAYVATANVDATAADVTRLGGKLIVPPTDIPTVGRFTVFSDNQGPVLAAFTALNQPPGHEGEPHTNEFGFHELATGDYQLAFNFYHTLFGWDRGPAIPMGGDSGTYQMLGRNGLMIGGIYNKPETVPAPFHWVHYVLVDNVDRIAARVPTLGGKVMHGPMDVPNGPRLAMFTDPQGAMFAVYSAPTAAS